MGELRERRRFRLIILAGISALILGPFACDHPVRRGSIDLIVTVPDEVTVQAFTYELSGNGIVPAEGGVHDSKPQKQFEKLINFIPAGDGYDLDVNAKSVDGRFICKGMTNASVYQHATTRVRVALACLGADHGDIVVSVGVAVACPSTQLADFTVAPLTTAVGGTIAVTATASEADAGARSYHWSALSGRFADPSSATTTYLCEVVGSVTLSLHVSAVTGCADESYSIQVDCLAPSKGAAAN